MGGRGVCTWTYLGPNRRGGGDTTMENFGAKLRAKLEKLRANRERGKYLLANDRERLPEEEDEEHGVVPGESAGIGRYTPPTRQEERERMQDTTYEVRRRKKKRRKERGRTEEEAERKRRGIAAFRNQTC